MKAVYISEPTTAENVSIADIPIPNIKSGWVLIKVKAFGMNHSEQILRRSEIKADYIKKPIVPGIECVGEIADPSDSDFKKGEKVAALMGGMGRSFDGSYAEYTLVPTGNVFSVNSDLPWENLAAVPETYFTAYASLIDSLDIKPDDVLLIRGATCSLGYAAIQIAQAVGCKIIATTHRKSKIELIADADEAIFDDGALMGKIRATKALELVGAKTLRDTLRCMTKNGIVCYTGILGGVFALDGFDPIKEIPNGVYLTSFFSNYPTQHIVDDIFGFISTNKIVPAIGRSFEFDDIREACIALNSGSVNGKIVVKLR